MRRLTLFSKIAKLCRDYGVYLAIDYDSVDNVWVVSLRRPISSMRTRAIYTQKYDSEYLSTLYGDLEYALKTSNIIPLHTSIN
jgi:hypothetical protein